MTRLLNGEYIQRGCASFDTPSSFFSSKYKLKYCYLD